MDDPQKIDFDNNFADLMSEFQKLSTFAEVKDWGKRAGNEIERIMGLIRALDLEIARDAQTIERIKFEHTKKPLVGRLFGGTNNEEKELTQGIEEHRQTKMKLAKAAQQLQDSIDFTPSSAEQQKKLVQELRQRKKELQEKKREITMVIRTARPSVQEPVEQVFDTATINRRKARYARDAQVLPDEKANDAMDRQFAQIERDILWVEKFNQ